VNYDEAVAWLYASQLHGIKLGLENVRRLAGALEIRLSGSGMPKFIHVAGTNGKGSVCAMVDSCCRAAGLRSGLFTSPHLLTFRERIRIDGEMIGEAEVAAGLTRIRELIAGWEQPATFFEIVTALALEWFQREGVEVVALETGLGGRLDATNIVTPAACAFTSIDLDHQESLGASLTEIAREKAGIIKPGVAVVSIPQSKEVHTAIAEIAGKQGVAIEFLTEPLREFEIGIIGSHQQWNAALACRAMALAGLPVSKDALTAGLRDLSWPGRFHQIHPRFIIDGAHNPAAAHRLASTWREVYGDKRATLILGILRDKDVRGICEALLPIAGRILAVPVSNPRSATSQEICKAIGQIAPRQECIAVRDLGAAIRIAESMERRALITGSLFLAGEAIAHFESRTPPERSAQ